MTKLTVHADIIVPRVPNFLRFESGEGTLRVGDVTDESLRGLGAEWTDALLKRAAEQRREMANDVPSDPTGIGA